MKRIIALWLSAIFLLPAFAEKVTIGDFVYDLNGREATVVSYLGDDEYPVVPETVTEKGLTFTVKYMGSTCFYRNKRIIYVQLPKTLQEIKCPSNIKEGAFEASTIQLLVFPPYIEHIGCSVNWNYWDECSYLQTVIFTGSREPSDVVPDNFNADIYVPDRRAYSFGTEMVTFKATVLTYGDRRPVSEYVNNLSRKGFGAMFSGVPECKYEVGHWCDTLTVQFNNADFVSFIAKVPRRYTVKKKELTVRVLDASREDGEEIPQFRGVESGFVNGEDESVLVSPVQATCAATRSSAAGTYPIQLSGGAAKNYELVYEPGELTVTKAPLAVRVKNETREYGLPNPDFRLEYSGLKNGEASPAGSVAPSLKTSATPTSPVGDYTIEAKNGEALNYEVKNITPARLTVTKAPLTVRANSASRFYAEENPPLTYRTEGFRNGEDERVLSVRPTLTTSATKQDMAGTYEVVASGAEARNYEITYVPGTLEVLKRSLTVYTDNYTRRYGEENPYFELTYNGFVNGEDEDVLTRRPEARVSAGPTADTGVYPIVVSGGEADNYDFEYHGGSLTIEKADQTLTWDQDLTALNIGDQIELTARASSGLPVEYVVPANDVLSLYEAGTRQLLDCFGTGEVHVRAVQPGNQNYYPSERLSKRVRVIDPVGITAVTKGGVRMAVVGRQIVVAGLADDQRIRVSAADGRLVYDGRLHRVTVEPGVYVVQAAGVRSKVIVR